MLGLVKGVIVDGEVTVGEAQYLAHWINANPEAVLSWPGNALAQRLQRIFADGYVSDEEREDLRHFLEKMVGPDTAAGDVNMTTRLPLDDPPPTLAFAGWEYVFTGRFIWGTRTACEEAVARLGGVCGSGITKRTSVLVIGDLGSRDWIHTSYGRKIERAVEYRQAGVPLVITDEAYWASHLPTRAA
jgi:NAD-dependent DNA ligase